MNQSPRPLRRMSKDDMLKKLFAAKHKPSREETTDAGEKEDRSLKDMNVFNDQHEEAIKDMGEKSV